MSVALEVRGLAKRFGALDALRDASFVAQRGEVLGLIGPNGSGKSTLLECLAGLLAADAGDVRVDGTVVPAAKRRQHLFHLPDHLTPWADQAAGAVLDFHAALHGATLSTDARDALGIAPLRTQRLGALSKGQRKRVLLALALSTPHPIVMLDEPFDGLDLRQQREAAAVLRATAASGRAVIVSIHSMTDAERTCDRLVLLSDGRTAAEGTMDELRATAGLAGASLEEVFLALA